MLPTSPRFAVSAHSSYHPGGYGVSEGLKRARRPFIVRNAVTGAAVFSFAIGVYFYSISKVKQDDFSDLAEVRVPQAPVQATAPAAGASEVPAPADTTPPKAASSPAAALTGPPTINTSTGASSSQKEADKRRMV